MSSKRLVEVVALEVLRRVSCDSDVVIIQDQLHVEILGDCQSGSLSVISFLLGTIRPQHKDDLVLIGKRDTIDERPHVTQTARRELDSWGQAKLGVARELGVSLAVVEQLLEWDEALQCGYQILGSDTVTGFVEQDGDIFLR